MKKFLVLVLMCLLGASLVPVAEATIDAKYEVMPYRGPYDQKINIYVRCLPVIDAEAKTLYLFWDKMQINKLPSTQIAKTANYQHSWDISLLPPAGYNSEGKHDIDIWIENRDGEVKKLYWSYTITDGVPPISAWERYIAAHPEILAQLTGPKGETGAVGGAGARGAKGETGARGPVAEIDYAQLWASVPSEVLVQMRGERGIQGAPASNMVIGIGCVVSVVASAVFTWAYAQRKDVAS